MSRSNKSPAFSILFLGASVGVGILLGLLMSMYYNLPEIKILEEHRPNVVTKILAEDGTLITELFREKRIWVDYADIPENLKKAITDTEDHTFFQHRGIRFMSILRALIVDIRLGRIAQGGSTITQQLAKTLFLSPEKNIMRKVKEALMAIEIERLYTKREILELYLNQIYMGSGAYGVEAASQVYFGKSSKDLTLAESALIAGLPRAPSRYSPLNNIDRAKQRRATVLSRMKAENDITPQEEDAANAEPILLKDQNAHKHSAKYFVEAIRAYLEKKYGADRVYREGLTVQTTLNLRMQEAAESAISKGLATISERIKRARLYNDDVLPEAALVAIRPSDGAILAMVGGSDFKKSQFNRAMSAKRQAGSAFKPFIYLAALNNGSSPADIIVDSPVSYPDPTKEGEWKPVNFSKRFYGPVTLRRALEASMNVATVKLLDKTGVESVIAITDKLGFSGKIKPYLSLALGALEVTPLELTSAYAALANGGVYSKPGMVLSVNNADGENLEERTPYFEDSATPEVTYVLTRMLQGVVENGTGKVAKSLGRPVAAKTGTTSDSRDAWFLGYTPNLAVGVWVGFDDNRSLGPRETGGHTAGPIWTDFMKKALKNSPTLNFMPPERVVVKIIDRNTGKLATGLCLDTIAEVFITGTEPTDYCEVEGKETDRL
ncbi:Multimodular transpeptidase-transglycosylase [hydrothermal vent metagenome]|uniref:peptidoglycan glycosyltransferase n=1 Tax=hydrothermal vent metagenome TaxID=652676 RepID=A0A3B1CSP1_9ZZZZ